MKTDQPKPTTGEWTAEYVAGLCAKPFNSLARYQLVADAHNAALTAAQGAQHHMEACRALLKVPNDEVLYGAIEELQQQLAAEQDKRADWNVVIEDLEKALAAERESHAKTAKQFVDMKAYADATEIKLSAEREAWQKQVVLDLDWPRSLR